MKVKIIVDFSDDGEEHPLLQGFDVELDFKEAVDKRETGNVLVDIIRKILWT